MAKQEANWVNVDVETLPTDARKAYDAYKASYKAMKDARLAFETLVGADIPDGQRIIFGYNFGKLSVAIVEDDRKVAKPKAQTQSLSEFLAGTKAHGDRC